MTYQQIQPPDSLRRYVRYFWTLKQGSADGSLETFRPITDGCPGLFYQRTEPGSFYDQDRKQLPALFLYGQTIRHRELNATNGFDAVGVCITPGALKTVFGLDANELTDTCLDVNLLTKTQDSFLSERLLSAPSTGHQIELLSAYLLAQLSHNDSHPDRIADYALSVMIESAGRIPLKTLHQTLNVSERSFERRFRQSVGISPKLFSRVCRFQAALRQLEANRYDRLSDVAFDNGYADQSHFIRVFKEFSGFSPYQYRQQANAVGENLTQWTP